MRPDLAHKAPNAFPLALYKPGSYATNDGKEWYAYTDCHFSKVTVVVLSWHISHAKYRRNECKREEEYRSKRKEFDVTTLLDGGLGGDLESSQPRKTKPVTRNTCHGPPSFLNGSTRIQIFAKTVDIATLLVVLCHQLLQLRDYKLKLSADRCHLLRIMLRS